MKIGFIGAGKVGVTLGKFFSEGGIQVSGYYSRHQESREEAAAFTASKSYDNISSLVKASDAVFITVPDGSIKAVYEELPKNEIKGKQICHCSGAMTAEEAFSDINETGAYGFSIHPLFPVSSKFDVYKEIAGAFFCIEGDSRYIGEWKERLENLGPSVAVIKGENKIRYHAACAISSNLMCSLVQTSIDLLQTCGFSDKEALKALSPLIEANMKHVIEVGPEAALTGPVERNDKGTVGKHLECFETEDQKQLYRYASKRLVGLAEKRHPESDYGLLKELLEKED